MFVTTQENAYKKIRSMVLSGQFKPGQRVPEQKVSKLIGINRGPVRESLIKLHAEGLLISKPNRGFTVREYNIDDARQLYELREIIEGGAARLAAMRSDSGDIESIRKAHFELEKIVREGEMEKGNFDTEYIDWGAVEADEMFHVAILKASGNRFIEDMFLSLNAQHFCLTFQGKDRSERVTSSCAITLLEEHALIIDAILRGDPEEAEAEARYHVKRARENCLKSF